MSVVDRVRELVAPVVVENGADLYDVEFNGGILRLLVDRPGGIDIDAIKRISRAAGRLLDDADPVPGRYTLEVSSPGLERPLQHRHNTTDGRHTRPTGDSASPKQGRESVTSVSAECNLSTSIS